MEKELHNEINVILDPRVKGFMENGTNIVVDFRETMYGSGFIVDSGSHC